jgi:hypothetical protein
METSVKTLRNLLIAALAGLVLLLFAVIVVGNRVSDLEREVRASRNIAAQAMEDFRRLSTTATEVNAKMDKAMRKADTLDAKMAAAEARMNASIRRQMAVAEARMKRSIPSVMDAYVERKIREIRSKF